MQYIPKTMPGPHADLAAEKIKPSGTYRIPAAINLLRADFHNRCYLCEDSPQSINIEHFTPHRENRDLKFSWANLFWSCNHCNNTKGAQFDSILNCTTDVEIEEKLEYIFFSFPSEDATIRAIGQTEESRLTAKLLSNIHNGTTPLKRIESNELRKRICLHLHAFSSEVIDFECADDDRDLREYLGHRIKSKVRTTAKFASFTRAYLRTCPKSLGKLKAEIPDFPL
jgi:hypothetical protein